MVDSLIRYEVAEFFLQACHSRESGNPDFFLQKSLDARLARACRQNAQPLNSLITTSSDNQLNNQRFNQLTENET
jgi:hypothetical protein